jgi:hypothetical protein
MLRSYREERKKATEGKKQTGNSGKLVQMRTVADF